MAASLEEIARRAVSDLEETARLHKRSEMFHRKQARRLQERLAELRAECDRLGVELVVEHIDPLGRESHSVNAGNT
jgi:hypothetical protein